MHIQNNYSNRIIPYYLAQAATGIAIPSTSWNWLFRVSSTSLKYRYVLTDSWFASKENLTFIRQDLDRHFIMALKSNRTVALSEEDRKPGRFTQIDSLEWTEYTPRLGWIKRVDFPVWLHRQVFTNQDGSIRW